MPYVTAFSVVLLSILMGACASADQTFPSNALAPYLVEAEQRYGKQATVETFSNEAETHILVLHQLKPTPQQPLPMVSYFVYNLKTDAVVYDETTVQGYVAWEDNRFLKVEITPGTVPGGQQVQQPVYYIDTATGTRLNEKE